MSYYFFAENKKANIDYIKSMGDKEMTPCLWLNGGEVEKKDYEDMDFGYFIGELDDVSVFKDSFYRIIRANLFSPDYIIIKGVTEDFWPMVTMLMEGIIDIPCFAILDGMDSPLSEHELMILDHFETVYFMGPTKGEDAVFLNILQEVEKDMEESEKMSKKIIATKEFESLIYNKLEVKDKNSFIGEGIKSDIASKLKVETKINGYQIL